LLNIKGYVFQECSYLRETLRDAEEKARQAVTSSEVTRRENIALANQVQNFLKAQIGSSTISSDAFLNVNELQSQNQELLQKLNRTQVDLENLKQETTGKLIQANSILSEFDRLKEERKTQEDLVKSIVQQRDMYRNLLSKQDSQILKIEAETSSGPNKAELETKIAGKEREIHSLSGQVERLNQHSENLIKGNDELRTKLLGSSTAFAKASSSLSFAESQMDQLQRELTSKSSRIDSIEKQNAFVSSENEKLHIQSISHSNTIMELQSKITDLESSNKSLSASKISLESSIGRLNGEMKVLLDQKEQNANLLASLQRIELQVHSGGKTKTAELEEEISKLQKKLLESVPISKFEELKKQLSVKEIDLAVKEGELKSTREAMDSSKSIDKDAVSPSVNEDLTDKLAELKLELSDCKKNLETYKKMAKEFETLSQNLVKEKESTSAKLVETQTFVTSQKSALEELSASFQSEKNDLLQQISSFKDQNIQFQSKITQFVETIASGDNEVKLLKEECLVLRSNFDGMSSNYDRELAMHSQCRTELNKLKQEFSATQAKQSVDQSDLSKAHDEVSQSKAAYEEMKSKLELELSQKDEQIKATQDSAKMLNEKVSDVLEKFATNSDKIEAGEVNQDLRAVVEYQQNERRILDAEILSLRGNLERESVNLRVVQRALDEVKAELALQKESVQESSVPKETSEQITLLIESNSHLRGSSTQLSIENKDLLQKIQSLEGQVVPLRAQIQEKDSRHNEYEAEIEVLKKVSQSSVSLFPKILLNEAKILI